ncbi:hypothetical protein [Pseudomonas fulva]|uniref:tetratricopeptide repeat protein n=1 Tax=Pseudomonas fulva TaxID=47880 RepID=UPI002DBC30FC|nr:hypothetical protein [Pseudomonas fulva]MEB8057672.1 hypothetical protein [Pseudomonas fulva]
MKKKPDTISTLVGYLDNVTEGRARGWVYSPKLPEKNFTVSIYSDRILVGQGMANLYREDLETAGIGNGQYAFEILLSYELGNIKRHLISARVDSEKFEITGSPLAIEAWDSKLELTLMPREVGRSELDRLIGAQAISNRFNKRNIQIAFELASMLQETYRLQEAAYSWNAIHQIMGPSSLLLTKQAEVKRLAGQDEEALTSYKDALELDITAIWAQVGLIDCYIALHRYSDAMDVVKVFLDIHPSSSLLGSRSAILVKMLTPADPAYNKFIERFSHLKNLIWHSNGRPDSISESNTVSGDARNIDHANFPSNLLKIYEQNILTVREIMRNSHKTPACNVRVNTPQDEF